jgi:hypothetical protein
MASIATFALKAGEWFRLVLLVIFLLLVVTGTSCPTGAGNPLIPTVQFSGATSQVCQQVCAMYRLEANREGLESPIQSRAILFRRMLELLDNCVYIFALM